MIVYMMRMNRRGIVVKSEKHVTGLTKGESSNAGTDTRMTNLELAGGALRPPPQRWEVVRSLEAVYTERFPSFLNHSKLLLHAVRPVNKLSLTDRFCRRKRNIGNRARGSKSV